MQPRLLAVDPSLNCSGWALFTLKGGELRAVGKIRSLSPKVALSLRLIELQQKVKGIFEHFRLGEGDVLICEAPTTMRDPRAAFKVEQVRGIFETLARELGLEVPGRLNPRTVQREMMGLKGRQLARAEVKRIAAAIVARIHGEVLTKMGFDIAVDTLARHQDIVDAVLLGSLAVSRVQAAHTAKSSLSSMFAPKLLRGGRRLPR